MSEAETGSNLPVRISTALIEHGKAKCWSHLTEGMLQASKQLIELEEKKRAYRNVLSIYDDDKYLNLARDLIFNDVRAGGYLPQRYFIILILELMFCEKKTLIGCLNDLKNVIAECPQSQSSLNILKSYTDVLDHCFSSDGDITHTEITLFLNTSTLFDNLENIIPLIVNKYRLFTKKGLRDQKLLPDHQDSIEQSKTDNINLWQGRYAQFAELTMVTWASSLALRMKEYDLAATFLNKIPEGANSFGSVRRIKGTNLAERGRELHRTEGPTNEVYDFLLNSLSTFYSGDVVLDIANCLQHNFRSDILQLFRKGGKFYESLDIFGKISIVYRFPLDESIKELELLIEESIKEQVDLIVHTLSQQYIQKGWVDKAETFITSMENLKWDFEKSGKADHVLQAKFDLAVHKNDHNSVKLLGEQFFTTYKRDRVTSLVTFYYSMANACFQLEEYDLAIKYCNKALKYNANYPKLWDLKEKIVKKSNGNRP